MAINFQGYVFKDNGDPLEDADVDLLETGTTTVEASTTTNSAGLWAISEADQDRYDVRITHNAGGSKRYIRWDDQISLKEIDVRNNTGATTPAATFTNLTNSAANQVAVFSGANSTKADNDEIYLSFKMADSAGNLDEFARITVVATDVSTTTEDGQIEFDVIKAGTLTKVWTITSSDASAMTFDMNVDALTIGSGADTDISLTFDANSADGVITWMEDEDYFKFSDDILMNSTERINFYDTAIYIYSSTDGQLDLVADTEIQIAATTIDINGAVALNGAITGATNITLSGELDAATLDLSSSADIAGDLVLSGGADGALQFTNAGENSIKIPDNQSSALIIEEANNAYITFNTTDSSEAITVAKATTFSSTIAAATGSTIGNLTLANGSITDSGGALDFGNETLTTTGAVDFGAATLDSVTSTGDFTTTGQATDWDLIDNTASALSFDASGKGGILEIITTNSSEGVSMSGTLTVGVDDTGQDVKFFGATTGAYMLWDESEDRLVLNQGADDGVIFSVKSSDIDTGMTSAPPNATVEADDYFVIRKFNNASGGVLIESLCEDAVTGGLNFGFEAIGGTAHATKTTSGRGLIEFYAAEHNGSNTLADITSDGNVFAIRARVGDADVTRMLVDEDGDLYSVTSAQTFDKYDDAQMVRALDQVKGNVIRDKWDDYVQYNEQALIDADVLGAPASEGGMTNVTQLQRLHNGAIWQGYVRQQEMQERMEILENKLLAIEGGK